MRNFSPYSKYQFDSKVARKLLIDLGLKQGDLAARLPGLSQQAISRYLHGQGRNPLIQQAIAEVLGVPLDTLLAKPPTSHATPKRRQKTRTPTASASARTLAAAGRE